MEKKQSMTSRTSSGSARGPARRPAISLRELAARAADAERPESERPERPFLGGEGVVFPADAPEGRD